MLCLALVTMTYTVEWTLIVTGLSAFMLLNVHGGEMAY